MGASKAIRLDHPVGCALNRCKTAKTYRGRRLESSSFIHVADLHLGYTQYNLDTRREDFSKAFREVVDKTIKLKPDIMIIAGDIFHHARPSNLTLETAIKEFSRLKDADIPALVVDGSHDAAPNVITGTILTPLDTAGLLYYLPRHEGACWQNNKFYVYGIPNYRTRRKTEELLPVFYEKNKPTPKPDLFNIFVFHIALDLPQISQPPMEAEAPPELLPKGFNYYAGGHIHQTIRCRFNTGILAYSGSIETVHYDDATQQKGFCHIQVTEKGDSELKHVNLKSPRHFAVIENDYTSMTPAKITQATVRRVKEADEEGVIIVPVLKGELPAEANRSEIDLTMIRSAAEKALLVHPIIRLSETKVPETLVREIFEGQLSDLRSKTFQYFLQVFRERYPKEKATRMATLAVNLIEPLTQRNEESIKKALEEHLDAD